MDPTELDRVVIAYLNATFQEYDWCVAWPDDAVIFDFQLAWSTRQNAELLAGSRAGTRYYYREESGWIAASA